MNMIKQAIRIFAFVVFILFLVSCKPELTVIEPTYSPIKLTPDKEVYEVGDTVICSIALQTFGSDNLQASTYWFYASWWFADPLMTADFQEFVTVEGRDVCTSSPIVLTQAGDVKIYFFGRLEYPEWDFRKKEIPVNLKVIEKVEK